MKSSCPGTPLKGDVRQAGLAWAREWRRLNLPAFEAMDAAGMFADSPRRQLPSPPAGGHR